MEARLLQQMLARYGIKPVSTTLKNPQANSIRERMHQTMMTKCA